MASNWKLRPSDVCADERTGKPRPRVCVEGLRLMPQAVIVESVSSVSLHPAIDPNEALLSAAQVRALFGDVSDMWLFRRLADPDSGFPAPVVIANRRFWQLGQLRQWRDSQRSVTRRPPSDGARARPRSRKRRKS
jgi:hypothetical protein